MEDADITPAAQQAEITAAEQLENPNASAPAFNIFPELEDNALYSIIELASKIRGTYSVSSLRKKIETGALRAFGQGRSCRVVGSDFKSFFWESQRIPTAANDNTAPVRDTPSARSRPKTDRIKVTFERKETVHLNYFEQIKRAKTKKGTRG